MNSRLDEMQAAILRERLQRLPAWTAQRRAIAARYRAHLADGAVQVPREYDAGHVYHLFVIRVRSSRPRHDARDALQASLRARGIETLIHYPVPIPQQPALDTAEPADCPIANRVCAEVLSVPLYPSLADEEADLVATAISAFRPA